MCVCENVAPKIGARPPHNWQEEGEEFWFFLFLFFVFQSGLTF